MECMYDEKTVQSLPKFYFSEVLSLSANLKHYCSTTEFLKLPKKLSFHTLKKNALVYDGCCQSADDEHVDREQHFPGQGPSKRDAPLPAPRLESEKKN